MFGLGEAGRGESDMVHIYTTTWNDIHIAVEVHVSLHNPTLKNSMYMYICIT